MAGVHQTGQVAAMLWVMHQHQRTPAAMPLRPVLLVLVLAGLGLWQAWNCTSGMAASPMTAVTMTAEMTPHHASIASAEHATHDSGMPTSMTGLCISVLASVAAVLMLMSSPLKLLAILRRMATTLARPPTVMARAPALAQLCVART